MAVKTLTAVTVALGLSLAGSPAKSADIILSPVSVVTHWGWDDDEDNSTLVRPQAIGGLVWREQECGTIDCEPFVAGGLYLDSYDKIAGVAMVGVDFPLVRFDNLSTELGVALQAHVRDDGFRFVPLPSINFDTQSVEVRVGGVVLPQGAFGCNSGTCGIAGVTLTIRLGSF